MATSKLLALPSEVRELPSWTKLTPRFRSRSGNIAAKRSWSLGKVVTASPSRSPARASTKVPSQPPESGHGTAVGRDGEDLNAWLGVEDGVLEDIVGRGRPTMVPRGPEIRCNSSWTMSSAGGRPAGRGSDADGGTSMGPKNSRPWLGRHHGPR